MDKVDDKGQQSKQEDSQENRTGVSKEDLEAAKKAGVKLDENGNIVEGASTDAEDKTTDTNTDTSTEPDAGVLEHAAIAGVQKLIVEAGINPQELAVFVTKTDGELPSGLLDALKKKHGDTVAELVIDKIKAIHSANKAQSQKRTDAVYAQVKEAFKDVTDQSGEATWKELSDWAKTNLDEDTRTELNVLLSKGGFQAKMAVSHLVQEFKSKNVTQTQTAKLLPGDSTANFGVVPMNRVDYHRELDKLLNAGHDYNTSPQIAELNRKRQAGMKAGI